MLGVTRTVTETELKSAYRKLALQFHPDRNPNNPDAEERFKEVSEAYAILADSEKRSVYDRYGHAGLGGAASQAAGIDPTVFQDFSDIFGEFFGFHFLARSLASPFAGMRRAKSVTDRVRLRAKVRQPAAPATGAGKFVTSRDSSALRAHVRHAKDPAA